MESVVEEIHTVGIILGLLIVVSFVFVISALKDIKRALKEEKGAMYRTPITDIGAEHEVSREEERTAHVE